MKNSYFIGWVCFFSFMAHQMDAFACDYYTKRIKELYQTTHKTFKKNPRPFIYAGLGIAGTTLGIIGLLRLYQYKYTIDTQTSNEKHELRKKTIQWPSKNIYNANNKIKATTTSNNDFINMPLIELFNVPLKKELNKKKNEPKKHSIFSENKSLPENAKKIIRLVEALYHNTFEIKECLKKNNVKEDIFCSMEVECLILKKYCTLAYEDFTKELERQKFLEPKNLSCDLFYSKLATFLSNVIENDSKKFTETYKISNACSYINQININNNFIIVEANNRCSVSKIDHDEEIKNKKEDCSLLTLNKDIIKEELRSEKYDYENNKIDNTYFKNKNNFDEKSQLIIELILSILQKTKEIKNFMLEHIAYLGNDRSKVGGFYIERAIIQECSTLLKDALEKNKQINLPSIATNEFYIFIFETFNSQNKWDDCSSVTKKINDLKPKECHFLWNNKDLCNNLINQDSTLSFFFNYSCTGERLLIQLKKKEKNKDYVLFSDKDISRQSTEIKTVINFLDLLYFKVINVENKLFYYPLIKTPAQKGLMILKKYSFTAYESFKEYFECETNKYLKQPKKEKSTDFFCKCLFDFLEGRINNNSKIFDNHDITFNDYQIEKACVAINKYFKNEPLFFIFHRQPDVNFKYEKSDKNYF